ncbi:MAG: hypothetical protein WCC66_12255 [Rhizobiaceae bacterium]
MGTNVKHQTIAASSAGTDLSSTSMVWIGAFPVATVLLYAIQPSAQVSIAMAVTTSVLMMVFAAAACDPSQTAKRLYNMAVLSPVLAALFIWIAVYAGRVLGGDSLVLTALVASISLAGLYLLDALVSGAGLFAASRGRAAPGAAIATLIHGKYAGLFGRIS